MGKCVPKYLAVRGGQRLKTLCCSKDSVSRDQCNSEYIVLKNESVHDHLKEEKGRIITTSCIAPGHFVACVTGRIVDQSQKHVLNGFDMKFSDGKVYCVSPQLDTSCEKTKAVLQMKGSISGVTACGLFKYSSNPNANVDQYGYVWATRHIKKGEAILININLTTMILCFKRYRKQLQDVPIRAFFEPFGEVKEGEESKSVLQYLVDNESTYSYKLLSKYLPQVIKSDEYRELANADASDVEMADIGSQQGDMEEEDED